MKNEVGNKYGMLTVLARAEKPEGRPNGAYWLCKCDCGNTKVIRGTELRTGGSASCGCLYGKHSIKNELGKSYGYLTVIAASSKRRNGATCWLCKCKCGNEVFVTGADLRTGAVKSCGCLLKEKSRLINSIDLTGKKFGKLTVLEIDEERTSKNSCDGLYWHCLCDCGSEITVLGSNLKTGGTKSCGCIKVSYGEELIAKFLTDNNISFLQEYTFPGLVGEENVSLRFDFAVLNRNKQVAQLIEYDGEQHFKEVSIWGGADGLARRKVNDYKKDQYCLEHNIKLVRIPYWKLKDLTFSDLEVNINELS